MSLTDTAISVTGAIGALASFGTKALPFAEAIAPFLGPYGPAISTALGVARPILEKLTQAAPVAKSLIESGRPVLEAIERASPDLLQSIKELYAIAVNHDPDVPRDDLDAEDVPDQEALAFAAYPLMGRDWTQEEQERWWDKAKGDVSNA